MLRLFLRYLEIYVFVFLSSLSSTFVLVIGNFAIWDQFQPLRMREINEFNSRLLAIGGHHLFGLQSSFLQGPKEVRIGGA